MAEGRDPGSEMSFRRLFPWTEIFRCFQVALDPRKLAVAALGIFAVSLGWYVLSTLFYYDPPKPSDEKYSVASLRQEPELKDKTDAELILIGQQRYAQDRRYWEARADLTAPRSEPGAVTGDPEKPVTYGRMRAMPWDEYRGPNPYLFVTNVLGGSTYERSKAISDFLSGSVPVLVEPLVKFLIPVSKLFNPDVTVGTRFFLILAILWYLAVWGFCAGVITRLAVVSLTNKGPLTLKQTIRFVASRYLDYFISPLVPLIIIAAVVVGLIVYGFLSLIPILGDVVLLGLGLPVIVAAGAVIAIFLIGLVGYPLMYTTLSTEGDSSDTFDALSRSINYVYQSPWNYIWYGLVTVIYGAIVTFFVLFFVSLSVYLGKWAVSQTPLTETFNRNPNYLFLWAPESFGWRELLLHGSPAAVKDVPQLTDSGRVVVQYVPINPEERKQYRNSYYFYNVAGAGIVAVWLTIIFLMMLGFVYSFYWSAAAMIYLLMRKKVDEAELDEVYIEEEELESPLPSPKAEPSAGTSLTVLPPPVGSTPPPSVPSSTSSTTPLNPAPAATIPFTPPPGAAGGNAPNSGSGLGNSSVTEATGDLQGGRSDSVSSVSDTDTKDKHQGTADNSPPAS